MSNLHIAHVPVNADDTRFLDEWRQLLLRAEPELQLFTPEWYQSWVETRGGTRRWQGKLTAITVRDSMNVLRGLLPLGHKRVGPLKMYASAGDAQPWRPILTDIACAREAGLAMGRGLRRLGLPALQIGPTPSRHVAFEALVEGLGESHTPSRLTESRPLATSELPATWEEFRSGVLSAKFARKIGYYDRRFRKTATIEVEHFRQPSPEMTRRLIQELGRIEAHSWMATAENSHPRYMPGTADEMWRRVIDSTLAPADQLDCWVMRADSVPVSFAFTLTAGTTRFLIANNYDEAVAAHSTGSTLYQLVFEEAIARGVRKIDFGTDEIHYKQRWGATYSGNLTTLLVGSSLPARLAINVAGLLRRPSEETIPTTSEVESADGQPLENSAAPVNEQLVHPVAE